MTCLPCQNAKCHDWRGVLHRQVLIKTLALSSKRDNRTINKAFHSTSAVSAQHNFDLEIRVFAFGLGLFLVVRIITLFDVIQTILRLRKQTVIRQNILLYFYTHNYYDSQVINVIINGIQMLLFLVDFVSKHWW